MHFPMAVYIEFCLSSFFHTFQPEEMEEAVNISTSHPPPAYVLTTDDKSPGVFPYESGLYVPWRVELGDNCTQTFLLDRIYGRKFLFYGDNTIYLTK